MNQTYAGFWRRCAALIIDQIIIGIINFAIYIIGIFLLIAVLGISISGAHTAEQMSTGGSIAVILIFLGVAFLTVAVSWGYFIIFEGSSMQATLGKKLLSIKVTNMSGERISYLRSAGRFFGKIISGLIFMIGFLMAALTCKKQALHDMMADCLVVDSNYGTEKEPNPNSMTVAILICVAYGLLMLPVIAFSALGVIVSLSEIGSLSSLDSAKNVPPITAPAIPGNRY